MRFTASQLGEMGLSALLSVLLSTIELADALSLMIGLTVLILLSGVAYCVLGARKGEFSWKRGWKV